MHFKQFCFYAHLTTNVLLPFFKLDEFSFFCFLLLLFVMHNRYFRSIFFCTHIWYNSTVFFSFSLWKLNCVFLETKKYFIMANYTAQSCWSFPCRLWKCVCNKQSLFTLQHLISTVLLQQICKWCKHLIMIWCIRYVCTVNIV